jgi:rRNA maturation endonuclease Nob1
MKSYWRERAKPIIAKIILEVGLQNKKELREKLINGRYFNKNKLRCPFCRTEWHLVKVHFCIICGKEHFHERLKDG